MYYSVVGDFVEEKLPRMLSNFVCVELQFVSNHPHLYCITVWCFALPIILFATGRLLSTSEWQIISYVGARRGCLPVCVVHIMCTQIHIMICVKTSSLCHYSSNDVSSYHLYSLIIHHHTYYITRQIHHNQTNYSRP